MRRAYRVVSSLFSGIDYTMRWKKCINNLTMFIRAYTLSPQTSAIVTRNITSIRVLASSLKRSPRTPETLMTTKNRTKHTATRIKSFVIIFTPPQIRFGQFSSFDVNIYFIIPQNPFKIKRLKD